MNKYYIEVYLYHEWSSMEDVEVEVEAETKEEALKLAELKARELSEPDYMDATLTDTSLSGLKVRSCIAIQNPPKCPDTVDMFEGQPCTYTT